VHGITDAITSAIGDYGLYAVFLLMLVDAVLPAASELVMLYAGALAAGAFAGQQVTLFGTDIDSTGWAYVAIATAGVLGYTVGSVIGWGIGRIGGRPFLERHGRWVHVTPDRLERAEFWFDRYGDAAVFFSRVVPVVRSFISIPAGVVRMPLGRFTLLSFLGTIPWCFGLAGAGLALGTGWERFHHAWRYADYGIAALVAAAVLWLAYRMMRNRARKRSLERSAEG
jgi:membrane protein DedA with SNARE-associated domain